MCGAANQQSLCSHPPADTATTAAVPAHNPLQLVEGEAEVFGTSLDLGERLTIGGQKLALFSWQGCTLQLQGEPDLM